MIQVHRLEGFFRVAVAGGYTRAARTFPYPISQPGVHQQVRKLEEELGVTLFRRTGKDRVALTSHGRRLFEFCAPFFEGLSPVVRSLQEGRFGGVLRVEVAPLEMRHLIPSWVRRLRLARPDIEVHLDEVDRPDPTRLLRDEVDVVVDHIRHVPDGVETLDWATHHGFVVVPHGHPQSKRRRIDVDALRATAFVGYHRTSPEGVLQRQAMAHFGLDPKQTVSASSTEAILALVGVGLGFSVLPWPDRRGPAHRGVTALRVPGREHEYAVSLAFRARSADDPLLRAALDALPR